MSIESVNIDRGSVGTIPAGASGLVGPHEASGTAGPPMDKTSWPGFRLCPTVDIEAVAREYLGHLKEESRAALALSRIRKRLAQAEGNRVLAAMRKQSGKVRASAVFQGVVAMAAAVATAVSAGVGAAGGAAAQTGSTAASASSGAVAGTLARSAAGKAIKAAALRAGPQLVRVAAHADPYRIQADRLDVAKQKHQNLKAMQDLGLRQTEDLVQTLDRMKGRVAQIMDRAEQLESESRKTAASAVRV
jgi:hypothetical protein